MKVLIVGGGLIGLGIAWRAAQKGMQVQLVDAPSRHAASRVGAGLLIPAGGRVSPHHLALRTASAEMFPSVVAELEELTGLDCGYNACGLLTVAYEPGADASVDGLANCLRGLGVAVERLDREGCLKKEPGLSKNVAAGFYSDDHQIDPEKFAAALREAGRRLGVEYLEGRVTSVASRGLTLQGGEHLGADRVVVATGAWLAQLLSLPVFPVKGEVIYLKGKPGLIRHNLTLRREDLYIANRGDGRYVVGATEEEAGFNERLTAGDHLFEKACALVPALGKCARLDARVGFRPKVGDGLPLLGEHEEIVVAGAHYRNGILLTPITAKLIADYLESGETTELMEPFTPDRDCRHRDEK
jgi:glycine oxidase